jgi:hypothetical protein
MVSSFWVSLVGASVWRVGLLAADQWLLMNEDRE